MYYTKIQNRVIRDNDLKPNEKIVLIILMSYNNKGFGYSYPSISTIMQNANIKNRNTVIKIIKELEKKGYIRKETVKGIGNKYYLKVGE